MLLLTAAEPATAAERVASKKLPQLEGDEARGQSAESGISQNPTFMTETR